MSPTARDPSRNQEQVRDLPPPVAALLARLPAYPGSVLLVAGLNLALARQLPDDVKEHLQGRRMRIAVRDAGLKFDFAWQDGQFRACRPHPEVDLTIGASAHDFVRLARRQVDPDTLFFNRRLSMEGDTELGLVVKNALDALDLPVFTAADLSPPAVLDRLRRLRPAPPARRHGHTP
ncbi:MAG: SCP2 sterol-binding domain-containing protein [Burkholderiaceae bacterium]